MTTDNIKHKCEENFLNIIITKWNDKIWTMNADDHTIDIKFCPFCGTKLENFV